MATFTCSCVPTTPPIDQVTCSECRQPLSVGPVRLKLDGQNLCGRCNGENNPDGVPPARNYAYEALINPLQFPCIYKASGCNANLLFNDTTQHETFCCYRSYECPVKSDCAWSGIVEKLSEHYLLEHPELCMEDTSTPLPLTADYWKSSLLYFSGIYFVLQIRCDLDVDKLWFNCVYLGNPEDVGFMKFKLELGSAETKWQISSDEGNVLPHMFMEQDLTKSIEVDLAGVKAIFKQPSVIICNWKISIDNSFLLQRVHLLKLRCITCDNYMTCPIYTCKDGHYLCADCKGFDGDCSWCKDEDKISGLVRDISLESLCEELKLPCRWCGCLYHSVTIRQHEQGCSMRKYECPTKNCVDWLGSLDDLVKHLRCAHPQCHVHVATMTSETVYKSGCCDYIVAHREVFWCHFEKSDEEERLFQIYYKGPTSLADNFRYQLEVVNLRGVSKVYKLTRFLKNRYEVRVPTDEDRSSSSYTIKIIKRCL